MSRLKEKIELFFSAKGPLADRLEQYEPRAAQIEMAMAIADSLLHEKRLVVEAGTGTGKSLAYLAVALLTDVKVLISTATKTLQDQLFHKDLPLALKSAIEISGKDKRALLMKGRGNYLCLLKAESFKPTGDLLHQHNNRLLDRVRDFIRTTNTGDRAEIPDLPDDSPIWTEINAKAETCLGQDCPLYSDCFVTQMRRQAQSADVIIVNHSLLCADRSLRVKTAYDIESFGDGKNKDPAFAQILPDVDLWIIDEAHALNEVATRHFGVSISTHQVKLLMRDLSQLVASLPLLEQSTLKNACDSVPSLFIEMLGLFARYRNSIDLSTVTSDSNFSPLFTGINEHLRAVEIAVSSLSGNDLPPKAAFAALTRRVNKMRAELHFMLSNVAKEAGYVTFCEGDARSLILSAAPIDAAQTLARALWSTPCTIVLTSATLAINDKMDPFLHQSGFLLGQDNDNINQLILPAPFDFGNQSALYVPASICSPTDEQFQEQLEDEIRFLLSLSKGGMFVLFTSHRALSITHQNLKNELAAQGFCVFKQGDAPKLELLREFVAADDTFGGVLFATHSFWEGVDVRGKALRMVVIDRLPFRSPEDPILKARTEQMQSKGLSPFMVLSLPEAALTLKQGAGRLLRTHQDAGVVAILDNRIYQKHYGRVFIGTLPAMTKVRNRTQLKEFWEQKVQPFFC